MTLGVALVTGAARGIGRAIALRLAKDGFNIALNDIGHQDQLDSLRKEIEGLGRNSIEYIADVSKEAEVEVMFDKTILKLGTLDVMVANAGIGQLIPMTDTTVEEWDHMFDVNAKGVFLCYKHAARAMIKQGNGGRIIGASSVAGKRGVMNGSVYSATKFGVRGLTQSAAQELKPHGITVNAYAPGLIRTPLTKEYIEELLKTPGVLNTVDIGRPEDIAGIVSYLASKDAGFVTGQTINVNGGDFLE